MEAATSSIADTERVLRRPVMLLLLLLLVAVGL
jgi:hypothetical protein